VKLESQIWKFDLRGQTYRLRIPARPDEHMQEAWDRHHQDEAFFPFWLEVWKSSVVLFDYLLANAASVPELSQSPQSPPRVLEMKGEEHYVACWEA